MSQRVALVTDSTAALPAELVAALGITVVPLQVEVDGLVGLEGVDVGGADVEGALLRRQRVSTSLPTVGALTGAYREALAAADEVVSVHISSKLSGTVNAARSAATASGGAVVVLDSASVAMGLGFAVVRAAEAAAAGATGDDVADVARVTAAETRTLFYVDSLEHLRRGGRIGAASALLGTALSMKPILQVTGGGIAPLDKVRTASKALARLEERALEVARGRRVALAVHHLNNPSLGQRVADQLVARADDVAEVHVCEVGAVIGAHAGPGLVGVVISPC